MRPLFLILGFTGLVFVVAGSILIAFPPKKINHLWGYRSPRSMSSERNWRRAQLKGGRMLTFSGMISVLIASISPWIPEMGEKLELGLSLGLVLLMTLFPILFTEHYLRQPED